MMQRSQTVTAILDFLHRTRVHDFWGKLFVFIIRFPCDENDVHWRGRGSCQIIFNARLSWLSSLVGWMATHSWAESPEWGQRALRLWTRGFWTKPRRFKAHQISNTSKCESHKSRNANALFRASWFRLSSFPKGTVWSSQDKDLKFSGPWCYMWQAAFVGAKLKPRRCDC